MLWMSQSERQAKDLAMQYGLKQEETYCEICGRKGGTHDDVDHSFRYSLYNVQIDLMKKKVGYYPWSTILR